MDFLEFETLVKKAGLKKYEFANKVSMRSGSVSNWKRSEKIPNWVQSWLELYIENKKFKELKKVIKESGACEQK